MNNLKFLLVPSLSGSVQTWRTQSRVTLHSTPPNFFSGEMVLIFIKLTLHFKSACLPRSNSLSSQSEIRPVLMLLPVAEENFQKCRCVAYSEICQTNCIIFSVIALTLSFVIYSVNRGVFQGILFPKLAGSLHHSIIWAIGQRFSNVTLGLY